MAKGYLRPPTPPRTQRPPRPPTDEEVKLLLGLQSWHASGSTWCAPVQVGGRKDTPTSTQLRRMVKLGLVEVQAKEGNRYASLRPNYLYRLTQAGHDYCDGPEGQRVRLAEAQAEQRVAASRSAYP